MKKTSWLIVGFLLVAGIIFYFSSQPYSKQSLIPLFNDVLPHQWIEEHFSFVSFTYGSTVISIEENGVSSFVEFFVRKGAHIFIFACFAVFAYLVNKLVLKKKRWQILFSFLLTSGYAALDEYHQSLTGERTPMIQDVFLDMFGAGLGLTIALFITYLLSKVKKRAN